MHPFKHRILAALAWALVTALGTSAALADPRGPVRAPAPAHGWT